MEGMVAEETVSHQANVVVLDAGDPRYRRIFGQTLVSLQGVSDRVEGVGLGRAYMGLDGLGVRFPDHGSGIRLVDQHGVDGGLMPLLAADGGGAL